MLDFRVRVRAFKAERRQLLQGVQRGLRNGNDAIRNPS